MPRVPSFAVICGCVGTLSAASPEVARNPGTVSASVYVSLPASQAVPSRIEFKGTDGPIFGLAWAPDGQTLASAGFKEVHLWRIDSATPDRTFRMHTGLVRSVGWSPEGTRIASVGDDGVAHVWNTETLQSLLRLETGPARAIAWSPDGKRLATATASGTLQVWSSANGALLHSARLQTTISSVHWSPDGKTIVAGGINGMTTRWDAGKGTMIAKMYVSWPARNDVNGVTWSPNGQLVAIAHGARGSGGLTLWNPKAGTATTTLENAGGWLRGIGWSPDGQWLAVGGEDGNVRILNVETWAVVVTLPTDSKPIWSVAWSPDGRRLAAGNTGATGPPMVGGTVTVWEGPVPVLLGQRARARTRALEARLLERRVVTPVASRPKSPAAVRKDGGVYGTVTRLEPPFGNLETSFVLSDLRSVGIVPASRFDMRCGEKTFTILLGEHWGDVSPGEWVAYLSAEGDVIIARNGANASELSGCEASDSVFVTRGERR
jgi:WD40 repeat protein